MTDDNSFIMSDNILLEPLSNNIILLLLLSLLWYNNIGSIYNEKWKIEAETFVYYSNDIMSLKRFDKCKSKCFDFEIWQNRCVYILYVTYYNIYYA